MSRYRRVSILAMSLVVLLTATFTASAQVTSGSVAGTVKDAQGGVIPGATVTLISETKATKSTPVVTGGSGDFVFPNVAADVYTIQIEMPSFKILKQLGVSVSAGGRLAVGTLTLQVGGATETVDVRAEAPMIQASSGERSFTIVTDSVTNLPIANRSFAELANLAPGVEGQSRIGGGGGTNFMMDGVSTMDDGSNRLLMQLNPESVAEVKVLVSNYQAEYGRSSGLQITAVTKSGTNRYRGSLYDVERNSNWGPNSKTNNLNGNPKTVSQQRDWGYSIGGPVGKPGGTNKLFFYYAHEYEPRSAGNNVVTHRMPTALERKGDFSQTTDNNGAPYPYIKDPNLTAVCTAANTAGCFSDGGVLGRIPANRLYQIGLNVLNMYPMPNCPANCATWIPTSNYNFQVTRPTEHLLGWQPVVRLDYQPRQSLRGSFKYSAWDQRNQVINGTLPGFNDTKMYAPTVRTFATTVNYTFNPSTFLEVTYGTSLNMQTGCSLGLAGGPSFCTSSLPMNPGASLKGAGIPDFPFLFPNATIIDPRYYQYHALNVVQPPIWDGTRISKVPSLSYGSRIQNSGGVSAPPNIPYPGILNTSATSDITINLTKVAGKHTLKSGFYNTHALKQEPNGAGTSASLGTVSFAQDTPGTNPCDTSFGFSNAAMGCFSSFGQSSSFVEVSYIYYNLEACGWSASVRGTMISIKRRISCRTNGASRQHRCCTSPAAPTVSTPARARTVRP